MLHVSQTRILWLKEHAGSLQEPLESTWGQFGAMGSQNEEVAALRFTFIFRALASYAHQYLLIGEPFSNLGYSRPSWKHHTPAGQYAVESTRSLRPPRQGPRFQEVCRVTKYKAPYQTPQLCRGTTEELELMAALGSMTMSGSHLK